MAQSSILDLLKSMHIPAAKQVENPLNQPSENHETEADSPAAATPDPPLPPGLPGRPEALGADVLGCVHKAICEYVCNDPALPPLPESSVYRGNQTSLITPAGDEYCIFYELNHSIEGTPGRHFQQSGHTRIGQLFHYTIQCDFYSTDRHGDFIKARERAHIMEALANSGLLASILKAWSPALSCLYSDPATSTSELTDGQNFQQRYTVNLHISEYKSHTVKQAYFNSLDLHLTNVNSLESEG